MIDIACSVENNSVVKSRWGVPSKENQLWSLTKVRIVCVCLWVCVHHELWREKVIVSQFVQSFGCKFVLMSPTTWLSGLDNSLAERSLTSLCIRKKEFKKCNSWFRSRRYRMALMWSAHLLRNSLSLIRCNSWRIRVRFFSRGHSFFADMMSEGFLHLGNRREIGFQFNQNCYIQNSVSCFDEPINTRKDNNAWRKVSSLPWFDSSKSCADPAQRVQQAFFDDSYVFSEGEGFRHWETVLPAME